MIKDSGSRTEFPSGAVRDIQEGKGRCDLLPLDAVRLLTDLVGMGCIERFKEDGKTIHLLDCIFNVCGHANMFKGTSHMLLEVSVHFEEGAKKYGENNWRKGIPAHCYIDSAVRHYLKWAAGYTDERHDRAFMWNILCCIWTCENMPELNDYAKKTEDEANG